MQNIRQKLTKKEKEKESDTLDYSTPPLTEHDSAIICRSIPSLRNLRDLCDISKYSTRNLKDKIDA